MFENEAILPSVREYDHFDWESVIEYNQRCLLLWAYNDKFYRNPTVEKPTEFDLRVAKWNLLNLTKFYEDPVMIAELLREAGMFDECLDVASKAKVCEEQINVLDKIIRMAQDHDNRPFMIE